MTDLTNIPKTTGGRIRMLRKNHNITQEQLSEQLSINNRGTIGQWEHDITSPGVNDLRRMADIFGCDVGFLLCDFDSLRIGSVPLSDHLGLSTAALDNLRSAVLSGDPYIEIVSQLLQDETLLRQSAAVVAANYGRVSQTFNAIDPFTGESSGRIISPEDLHGLDRQQLFSALCDFLDNIRETKKGSSNLETD